MVLSYVLVLPVQVKPLPYIQFLATLNYPDVNIVTVEDPVEYQMAGIGQVQVKDRIGLTFAAALRSILQARS